MPRPSDTPEDGQEVCLVFIACIESSGLFFHMAHCVLQ